MGEFYQIITELWSLIDVQNCVLLNIILTNGQIVIYIFCYKISGGEVCCMPAALYLPYMGVEAIWSRDQHYINIFSFPCIQNLIKKGQLVSEKKSFNFDM